MRHLAAVLLLLAAPALRAEEPVPDAPPPAAPPAVETPAPLAQAPAPVAEVSSPVPAAPEPEQGAIGKASGKGLALPGTSTSDRAGTDAATSWSKTLLACALTGLLLGAGVMLLKRLFPTRSAGKPSAMMEVLARTPVGPKQSVVLLRVAGRVIVVGVSPDSMATLTEIRDEQEVEKILLKELKVPPDGFKDRLAGVLAPFRPSPMGAFGKEEGADSLEGEIRSLERRVASWRLENGVEGGEGSAKG